MTDIFLEHYRGLRGHGYSPSEAAYQSLRDIASGSKPAPIRTTTVNPWFERNGSKYRWFEDFRDMGARDWLYADVIKKDIKHKGWFIDEFEEDVYRGVVIVIEAQMQPWGTCYLYGFECPFNPGSFCIANDVRKDIDDAAQMADNVAESFADDEREYREEEETKRREEEE